MNGWMIIFGGSMRAILRPRHYDCERREAPAPSRSVRIFEYPVDPAASARLVVAAFENPVQFVRA